MTALDFHDSDILSNYSDISDALWTQYRLTRKCHPDESCSEVGLPWEPDGLQPVQEQFTVGVLICTLRSIRKTLNEMGMHLWEDFVVRMKSEAVCAAKIQLKDCVHGIAISEFCSHPKVIDVGLSQI